MGKIRKKSLVISLLFIFALTFVQISTEVNAAVNDSWQNSGVIVHSDSNGQMYYTNLYGTLTAQHVQDSVDNTFIAYLYTEAKALEMHFNQLNASMGVSYIKVNGLSKSLTGSHTFMYDPNDGWVRAIEDTENLTFLYGRTRPVESRVYFKGDSSSTILWNSGVVDVSGDWTT
ncbi:hypothetical protein HK1_02436 [Tepidibacillus sp. HK-1]|nr:hypothetical protein HK1_02436 [Tepidibacillus sp. HK-1]